ncbi:hypothetical protein C4587_01540 [Candidatus Parcubacteria bacterium]|nr:MAG: hypothetical protein C4587_01540 [Candidatus Parcubacteria bacterium]
MRLAVNKRAWKDNDPRRWRIFIDPDPDPIFVKTVSFQGLVTKKNMKTKTLGAPDKRGVVAYLHCFCNLRVEKDKVSITLLGTKT